MTAEIAEVYPDSIASRLGWAAGDRILSVNGQSLSDLIQFQWEWAGETVEMEISVHGESKQYIIQKGYDENPGIRFAAPVFDGIRQCVNRCIFCFVDQMAPGCRASLYIKDDDYRLSFLQGSYVTLTNLSEADLRRIETEKLSPLYLSVHATDPVVRSRLLGREGPDRLTDTMERLGRAGIRFHCQVVLCPGYNDGDVLDRTVEDLGRMDSVLSVSVVPVGLTRFRETLPALRPPDKHEATGLIEWLGRRQQGFLRDKGTRFIWLADEFYIIADRETPEAGNYEDYSQWENGVGLIRGFLEETLSYRLPDTVRPEKHLFLAGGVAAMQALSPLWARLREVGGLRLELIPLENSFFGPSVNVSGLLTGQCLIRGLGSRNLPQGATVYLPDVMLRDTGDRFLDGLGVQEVSERLGLRLQFLPQNGYELLEILIES